MADFKREANAFKKYDDNGKMIAEILFPNKSDDVWDIKRTYVDNSLRGQGIADKLMQSVVDAAKEENAKLIPTCSYAVKWFEKHPEESDLLGK